MKKVFIGFVALLAITSCAKDYSCECKVKHEQSAVGYTGSYEEVKTHTLKGKEKNMESACKGAGYDISYTDSGVTNKVISVCELK